MKLLNLVETQLPVFQVVLIGKETDRLKWLNDLNPMLKKIKIVNLVGKLNLRQCLWVISKQDVFIGPDSGPTHIAAWLGVPTLLLYSGTNVFEQWKCLAPRASFIKKEAYCAPCHREECRIKGHICMTWITPKEVAQWLESQLKEKNRSA
jgi:ADP-heptose:LPS heptosyltransferase